MQCIEYNLIYEEKWIEVKLLSPAYGGSYYIIVDNMIHGTIVRHMGGWAVYPTCPAPSKQIRCLLYSDDFLALRDIIEEHNS